MDPVAGGDRRLPLTLIILLCLFVFVSILVYNCTENDKKGETLTPTGDELFAATKGVSVKSYFDGYMQLSTTIRGRSTQDLRSKLVGKASNTRNDTLIHGQIGYTSIFGGITDAVDGTTIGEEGINGSRASIIETNSVVSNVNPWGTTTESQLAAPAAVEPMWSLFSPAYHTTNSPMMSHINTGKTTAPPEPVDSMYHDQRATLTSWTRRLIDLGIFSAADIGVFKMRVDGEDDPSQIDKLPPCAATAAHSQHKEGKLAFSTYPSTAWNRDLQGPASLNPAAGIKDDQSYVKENDQNPAYCVLKQNGMAVSCRKSETIKGLKAGTKSGSARSLQRTWPFVDIKNDDYGQRTYNTKDAGPFKVERHIETRPNYGKEIYIKDMGLGIFIISATYGMTGTDDDADYTEKTRTFMGKDGLRIPGGLGQGSLWKMIFDKGGATRDRKTITIKYRHGAQQKGQGALLADIPGTEGAWKWLAALGVGALYWNKRGVDKLLSDKFNKKAKRPEFSTSNSMQELAAGGGNADMFNPARAALPFWDSRSTGGRAKYKAPITNKSYTHTSSGSWAFMSLAKRASADRASQVSTTSRTDTWYKHLLSPPQHLKEDYDPAYWSLAPVSVYQKRATAQSKHTIELRNVMPVVCRRYCDVLAHMQENGAWYEDKSSTLVRQRGGALGRLILPPVHVPSGMKFSGCTGYSTHPGVPSFAVGKRVRIASEVRRASKVFVEIPGIVTIGNATIDKPGMQILHATFGNTGVPSLDFDCTDKLTTPESVEISRLSRCKCKSGVTGGGDALVDGTCKTYCSKFGFCGTKDAFKPANGGLICRPPPAVYVSIHDIRKWGAQMIWGEARAAIDWAGPVVLTVDYTWRCPTRDVTKMRSGTISSMDGDLISVQLDGVQVKEVVPKAQIVLTQNYEGSTCRLYAEQSKRDTANTKLPNQKKATLKSETMTAARPRTASTVVFNKRTDKTATTKTPPVAELLSASQMAPILPTAINDIRTQLHSMVLNRTDRKHTDQTWASDARRESVSDSANSFAGATEEHTDQAYDTDTQLDSAVDAVLDMRPLEVSRLVRYVEGTKHDLHIKGKDLSGSILHIDEATYGSSGMLGTDVDHTEKVRSLVNKSGLLLKGNLNLYFKDTQPGKAKVLVIQFRYIAAEKMIPFAISRSSSVFYSRSGASDSVGVDAVLDASDENAAAWEYTRLWEHISKRLGIDPNSMDAVTWLKLMQVHSKEDRNPCGDVFHSKTDKKISGLTISGNTISADSFHECTTEGCKLDAGESLAPVTAHKQQALGDKWGGDWGGISQVKTHDTDHVAELLIDDVTNGTMDSDYQNTLPVPGLISLSERRDAAYGGLVNTKKITEAPKAAILASLSEIHETTESRVEAASGCHHGPSVFIAYGASKCPSGSVAIVDEAACEMAVQRLIPRIKPLHEQTDLRMPSHHTHLRRGGVAHEGLNKYFDTLNKNNTGIQGCSVRLSTSGPITHRDLNFTASVSQTGALNKLQYTPICKWMKSSRCMSTDVSACFSKAAQDWTQANGPQHDNGKYNHHSSMPSAERSTCQTKTCTPGSCFGVVDAVDSAELVTLVKVDKQVATKRRRTAVKNKQVIGVSALVSTWMEIPQYKNTTPAQNSTALNARCAAVCNKWNMPQNRAARIKQTRTFLLPTQNQVSLPDGLTADDLLNHRFNFPSPAVTEQKSNTQIKASKMTLLENTETCKRECHANSRCNHWSSLATKRGVVCVLHHQQPQNIVAFSPGWKSVTQLSETHVPGRCVGYETIDHATDALRLANKNKWVGYGITLTTSLMDQWRALHKADKQKHTTPNKQFLDKHSIINYNSYCYLYNTKCTTKKRLDTRWGQPQNKVLSVTTDSLWRSKRPGTGAFTISRTINVGDKGRLTFNFPPGLTGGYNGTFQAHIINIYYNPADVALDTKKHRMPRLQYENANADHDHNWTSYNRLYKYYNRSTGVVDITDVRGVFGETVWRRNTDKTEPYANTFCPGAKWSGSYGVCTVENTFCPPRVLGNMTRRDVTKDMAGYVCCSKHKGQLHWIPGSMCEGYNVQSNSTLDMVITIVTLL